MSRVQEYFTLNTDAAKVVSAAKEAQESVAEWLKKFGLAGIEKKKKKSNKLLEHMRQIERLFAGVGKTLWRQTTLVNYYIETQIAYTK